MLGFIDGWRAQLGQGELYLPYNGNAFQKCSVSELYCLPNPNFLKDTLHWYILHRENWREAVHPCIPLLEWLYTLSANCFKPWHILGASAPLESHPRVTSACVGTHSPMDGVKGIPNYPMHPCIPSCWRNQSSTQSHFLKCNSSSSMPWAASFLNGHPLQIICSHLL